MKRKVKDTYVAQYYVLSQVSDMLLHSRNEINPNDLEVYKTSGILKDTLLSAMWVWDFSLVNRFTVEID